MIWMCPRQRQNISKKYTYSQFKNKLLIQWQNDYQLTNNNKQNPNIENYRRIDTHPTRNPVWSQLLQWKADPDPQIRYSYRSVQNYQTINIVDEYEVYIREIVSIQWTSDSSSVHEKKTKVLNTILWYVIHLINNC